MKSFRLLPLMIFLWGCAQVTSLNMQRHQFGRQPLRIIWFQIAGLDAEHLAMLRFGKPSVNDTTEIERALCMGHAWSFDLYHLRPSARSSFLAQLTGKKDERGGCEDAKLKPIWNYLTPHGYKAGVLEVGARSEEGLSALRACGDDGKTFMGDTTLWLMQPSAPADATAYLPMVSQAYQPGHAYWDSSCNARGCGTDLTDAVSALYGMFSHNSKRHLWIVRDFSYAHALAHKDIPQAREILRNLDRSVGKFLNMDDADDVLVIVSGGAAVDLDFPSEGKEWQSFENKGAPIWPRQGELAVPVFAYGARAENFCGVFEEAQVFERALSGPKQQGLELKLINPFK